MIPPGKLGVALHTAAPGTRTVIMDVAGYADQDRVESVQLYLGPLEIRALAHLLEDAAQRVENRGACSTEITWEAL